MMGSGKHAGKSVSRPYKCVWLTSEGCTQDIRYYRGFPRMPKNALRKSRTAMDEAQGEKPGEAVLYVRAANGQWKPYVKIRNGQEVEM